MKLFVMSLGAILLLQLSASVTLASTYVSSCAGRCSEGRYDTYAFGQCACHPNCGFTCCPDYHIVCAKDPCDNVKCGPNAHCKVGDYGSHQCVCNKEYVKDGLICKKENPCNYVDCVPHSTCVLNILGQPECQCINGYTKDSNGMCKSINPCAFTTCGPNTDCIKLPNGKAKCVCQKGYKRVGVFCKRVYPCDGSPCHKHADCINNGYTSYTCKCKTDYYGDGKTCDYDPCRAKVCGPFQVCVQDLITGHASCECRPQYRWDALKLKCILKNPCSVVKCSKRRECEPNYQTGTAKCVCKKEFYEKNGKCLHKNPCILMFCGKNRKCVVNPLTKEGKCVCKTGYVEKCGECVSKNPCAGYFCPLYSMCMVDKSGKPTCACNTGYVRDEFGDCTAYYGNPIYDIMPTPPYTIPTIYPPLYTPCGDPDDIARGSHDGKCKAYFPSGYTVTYTCDKGYLMSGSKTRTCKNGIWTPEAPRCRKPIVNYCPQIKKPAHGNFYIKRKKYTSGHTVTFICDDGYKISGTKRLTCQGAVWNAAQPTCIPKNACDGVKCGPYGVCKVTGYGRHTCECILGYYGNGYNCQIDETYTF